MIKYLDNGYVVVGLTVLSITYLGLIVILILNNQHIWAIASIVIPVYGIGYLIERE